MNSEAVIRKYQMGRTLLLIVLALLLPTGVVLMSLGNINTAEVIAFVFICLCAMGILIGCYYKLGVFRLKIRLGELSNVQQEMEKHVTKMQETLNSLKNEITSHQKDVTTDICQEVLKNSTSFQPFSRILSDDDLRLIVSQWVPALGLALTPREIRYIACKIPFIECRLRGRLAAHMQDALACVLTLRAVAKKEVQILEIGTLFGVRSAMMYDLCQGFFERLHFTLIDPLSGYYGQTQNDPISGECIVRKNVEENFYEVGMDISSFTILQGMSENPEIIKQASEKFYDLIIIDGDHSYEGITRDYKNYMDKLNIGGYLVIDDWNTKEWPEVDRFIHCVPEQDKRMECIVRGWKTIVFCRRK